MPAKRYKEYLDLRDLLEEKKAQYIRPYNHDREVDHDRDREVNHDRDWEVDLSEVRSNGDKHARESRILEAMKLMQDEMDQKL